MQFALLDIVVMVVVFLSAMLAMVRGFSREVLSVGSWVAAAIAAVYIFFANDPLTPVVETYIGEGLYADLTAAAIAFVVTLIIVSVITMRISDFIIDSNIGALDRTLGFIFGVARGLLLFVVAIGMFNGLVPKTSQPTWITDAKTKPLLDNMANTLVGALPKDLESFVDIGKDIISPDEPPGSGDKDESAISEDQRNELERLIPDDSTTSE